MQQSVKAMLLAFLLAIVATNIMPPSAISADNKARITNMKVSDIKTMSDFKEKVYQEMIPDIDDPGLADKLAFRIEKNTGVMKELWMATLDLCNRKPEVAQAKYLKHLPELAKMLPEVKKMNNAFLNSEIHNIRVFWATSELLTSNFETAQAIFEQISNEDRVKCENLCKEYFDNKSMLNDSAEKDLAKQLKRCYNYRYIDATGVELCLVGRVLSKQCKENRALLATIESNRQTLKQLGIKLSPNTNKSQP